MSAPPNPAYTPERMAAAQRLIDEGMRLSGVYTILSNMPGPPMPSIGALSDKLRAMRIEHVYTPPPEIPPPEPVEVDFETAAEWARRNGMLRTLAAANQVRVADGLPPFRVVRR